MHPQFTASDIERFMSNVTIDPQTGCWLWTGDVQRRYGRFWLHGDNRRAHRVAYEMTGDPLPDDLLVCHTCDNPLCVRNDDEGFYELDGIQHPRRGHLWLGTHKDNAQDRNQKQRSVNNLKLHPELAARGERHGWKTHPESIPRGDTSPSRLHPERMARGERHGSRTHPESILRGENHPSHLHPERMARGEKNGARLYPERLRRGEDQSGAKLTEKIVREIRERYAAGGVTHGALAADYGIGISHVGAVIRREIWAHVT